MKAQILKIAGVKSEKEFYKKYPSEEAFMKKHGKEFKKAQTGAAINASQVRQPAFKPLSYQDQFNDVDKMLTGSTEAERQAALAKQQAAAPQGGGGGGFDIAGLMKLAGGAMQGGEGMEGIGDLGGAASGAGARYGRDIPKAQKGLGDWYSNNPVAGSTNYGQQTQSFAGQQTQSFAGPQREPISSVSSLKPAGVTYSSMPTAPTTMGPVGMKAPEEDTLSKIGGAVGQFAGPVGDLIGAFGELEKEKEARKAAEQARDVSKVSLQAAESIDVDARRQQSENIAKQREAQMPVNTGEEFFPIYGVGTNVLARNGLRLQGGGEIQNTYDPNDIYTDSGYEPLNDSNVKQYYYGGHIPQAQNGFANWQNSMAGKGSGFSGAGEGGGTPWGAISNKATGIGQSLMGGQNAGGKIGGTAGKAIGSIFGPAGGAIGEFVGGIAGNALDTNAKRMKNAQDATQRNMQAMANANMAKGIQAQNQSYMEDGGWVSNDWQPQVITSFGGLNEQDFYDYAHDGMESLRAGGHVREEYQPISNRGMQQYAMGGEVQTTWGGHAETISQNPYMPGSGETIMFRGKSHDESDGNGNTGIGVKYGKGGHDSYTDYAEYGTQEADADVEVERGEPAAELEDANGEKNLTVYGNLKIPNQYIDILGDKNAKGKKFKNYVADLSKIEAKQNKIVETSITKLNALNPQTQFDKLKLTSLQASIQGANMKLKDIADKKMNAAYLQNAINDTAEENGLVADDLARGKVKIDKEAMQTREARWGDAISKAQGGKTTVKKKPTRAEAIALGFEVDSKGRGKKIIKAKVEPTEKTVVTPGNKGTEGTGGRAAIAPIKDKYRGKLMSNADWLKFLETKQGEAYKQKYITGTPEVKAVGATSATPDTTEVIKTLGSPAEYEEIETEEPIDAEPKNKFDWINAAIPYLRPSDAEGLDTAQLYPEMFAMATNQVSPVQAQTFQPDLGIPYDISYQDQLNANQADYRAAQRTMGYNPAAQANLNAQKYQANQSVLANQFRANQEMKDKVYGENRNMLNQAKLTNLGIFDNQYERQTEALANTKATTQAALNSISDKYAKNKLENRELKTYENMYNYRFGPNFRAQNMNPLAQFDTDYKGASSEELEAMSAYKKAKEKREAAAAKKDAKETDKKRNGSIVKSYKNI